MNRIPQRPRQHYRAVWISDVHLGFRGCSADYLLEFLHSFDCDTLYLVGDIIDLWALKKRPCWPQAHNDVLRHILGKARGGTRVVYVPGNHDDPMRDYDGLVFGNITVQREVIHTRATASASSYCTVTNSIRSCSVRPGSRSSDRNSTSG